jgi:hypothetical protein
MEAHASAHYPSKWGAARNPFFWLGVVHPKDGDRASSPPLNTAMGRELTPAPELEREADEALVLSWRFEVLFRAGYSRNQAFLLARRGADLHLATELLERGCPVETAMEILL